MSNACHYATTFDDELAREFKKILSSGKGMSEDEVFSPDQIEGLALWLDASDKSTIQLTYSTDALGGATASGISGTTTITTSADVSSNLEVGSRIRLGAAGAVTTADTLGADSYTITNITGTTITVAETLTSTYSGDTLRRGLVSEWQDKSGQSNHAAQNTEPNMPLWLNNGLNGKGIVTLDGNGDYLSFNPNITSGSFFYTLEPESVTGDRRIIGQITGATSQSGSLRLNGGALEIWSGGLWLSLLSANTITTSTGIIGLIKDATSIVAYYNGTTGQTAVADWDYNVVNGLGAKLLLNHGTTFLGGFSEVIAYSDALSSVDRNSIEQHQANKWGIAL